MVNLLPLEPAGPANGWVDDYEWGICWDYERKEWDGWSPSDNYKGGGGGAYIGMGAGADLWQMSPPPPPGPPPGRPLDEGPPWLSQMLESGKGMGKPFFAPMPFMGVGPGMGPPDVAPAAQLDGPYVGDALPDSGGGDWGGGPWGGAPWKGGGGKAQTSGGGKGPAQWGSGPWKGGGGKEAGAAGGGGGKESGNNKWWQTGWQNQASKSWESWDDEWEEDGLKGAGKGKSKSVASKGVSRKGGAIDGGKKGAAAAASAEGKGSQRWRVRAGPEAPVPTVKGGGKGKRDAHDPLKEEVSAEMEAVLADASTKLKPDDFDFRVRRFLLALRSSQGLDKVKDALAMIQTFTSHKSRESVKNWPAYLLALLKKFEPDPFTKPKGRTQGRSGSQPVAEAPAAAKPAVPAWPEPKAKAAAPVVAVPQPATASPAASAARGPSALPQGWIAGRKVLLEEIEGVLAPGAGGNLRCPFTQQPLDCQATLAEELASCLRLGSGSWDQRRHAAGLARARELVECPRAAALGTVAGQPELTALPEDASAMDASEAAAALSQVHPDAAGVAEAMLQEIGLELAAEVLRNNRLSPPVSS